MIVLIKKRGVASAVRLPRRNVRQQRLARAYPARPEQSRVAKRLDPSIIANYLFELAQAFSQFYHACPVLNAEHGLLEARLDLVHSVANILKQGLYLLGIETIESM